MTIQRPSSPSVCPDLVRPDPLEVAAGTMLGTMASVAPFPVVGPGRTVAALEEVITRALRRPPCVVSFSGGRDSSASSSRCWPSSRTGVAPLGPSLGLQAAMIFPSALWMTDKDMIIPQLMTE